MSRTLKTTALLGAIAGTLFLAAPASAATYVSKLEYSDAGKASSPFGTVTLDEVDAYNVKVTVALDVDKIVDTGSHYAFTFNLLDSPNSQISILSPSGGGSFQYKGEGSFKNAPFGTFTNAFACCGQGASNGEAPLLIFNVYNASKISFAGVGSQVDANGRLISTGTGNRFGSNTTGTVAGLTGGWWFAVDTYDADRPSGGNTYVVGARDAFIKPGGGIDVVTSVPEPGAWALMIGGFGLAGVALRRRRALAA